jgi:hypothetical protein
VDDLFEMMCINYGRALITITAPLWFVVKLREKMNVHIFKKFNSYS